jgi:hypothetical protein
VADSQVTHWWKPIRWGFDGRKGAVYTSAEHAAFKIMLDPPDTRTH